MSKGRIIEQGSHDELFQKKETYYNLIEAQRIASEQVSEDDQDPDPILSKQDHGFSPS